MMDIDDKLLQRVRHLNGYLGAQGMTDMVSTVMLLVERVESARTPGPKVPRLLAAAKEALREHERRGWAGEDCMSRLSAAVAELEAAEEGQGDDGRGEA